MLIEFDYKDDVCIIRPRGRFVTGSDAEYLRKKTDELKSCGRTKVMTDLHDVPYADSTGIAFIVGAYTSVTNSLKAPSRSAWSRVCSARKQPVS